MDGACRGLPSATHGVITPPWCRSLRSPNGPLGPLSPQNRSFSCCRVTLMLKVCVARNSNEMGNALHGAGLRKRGFGVLPQPAQTFLGGRYQGSSAERRLVGAGVGPGVCPGEHKALQASSASPGAPCSFPSSGPSFAATVPQEVGVGASSPLPICTFRRICRHTW